MTKNELNHLQQIIESDVLWYQNDKIKYLVSLFDKKTLTKEERSDKSAYKTLLKRSNFLVGETGYNWDQWRLPIECAVIHHTSSSPTISLNELNVLGLRLYIQQYLKDEDVLNQPLYSGHYWYGKPATKNNMCFVSYHYLVRPSGKVVQLADNNAYLWHAGNLDINRKSISIALAGKFYGKSPTREALTATAKLLKDLKIPKDKVFGHCEVINKQLLGETASPGDLFVGGWKGELLTYYGK